MKTTQPSKTDCLTPRHTPSRAFWAGFRYGLPIMLGYAPVSFAFAVAAVGNGLPWPLVVLISATNLTSAGQQAGAGLMAAGAPLPEIGATVWIINLRYMLMSLSLSQKMQHMSLGKKLLLASGVTDEIFVLASQAGNPLSGWLFAGLIFGPYVGWVGGTALGALLGQVLPAFLSSALGIALFAMFIAILVPAAKQSRPVAAVIAGAVALSCLFRYVPPFTAVASGWALIICATLAAAVGAWLFPQPMQQHSSQGKDEQP